MEVASRKMIGVKDERKIDDEEVGEIRKVSTTIASEISSIDMSIRPSSSNLNDSTTVSQKDQLESTKQEMGEVREENERLKTVLARIVKDYQSLQMHFFDIMKQEQLKKPIKPPSIDPIEVEEPDQLVSLSLGTSSSAHKKEEKTTSTNTGKGKEPDQIDQEGLDLGLDCKFKGSSVGPIETQANSSPDNSFEEPKEEEIGEPWPPSKVLKNLRGSGEDEASQQAHVKKARVSVRARCDAPTMNDGCQWRKYGQKIAKGNPCPRAYYRCTVAPACPVRKQVQRCAEDMSILITTYEGTHNHPLPISATAMASTTSAAASMLISGSSTSTAATATAAGPNSALHGMNFSLSDNTRPRPFFLPNSSLSSSPSYPTITLDLTSPPSSTPHHPSQFNRLSSSLITNPNPRYTSTSLSFSSSDSNTILSSWSNGYLSYASQPYNKAPTGSSFYQSFMQKAGSHHTQTPTAAPNALTDTIAKAITSDPSFQSALASAITSYVGAHGAQGEHFAVPVQQPFSAAPVSNGCASSYLTRSTSTSSSQQQGSLMFLQAPLTFSSSKSTSASPVDNRENIN